MMATPRVGGALCIALLVVLVLFWLMQAMIAPPEAPLDEARRAAEIVTAPPPERPQQTQQAQAQAAPPPPPPAPAALARPEIPLPAAAAVTPSEIDVAMPASLSGGPTLGSGSFAGFGAGGGNGTGSGGGGYGQGQGFSGKPLVPLSTARPQMPDWACKRKIQGWVEVVFTVMPNGRVRDVRIVDADPRGVYEAAAVESVSNWIYASHDNAREVKQRVEMDPADCAYNYPR